jgi:hypothetical protein
MPNKSIKTRYSIEYAYPDTSEKIKSSTKWPLIVAGLIGIGVLSSTVIPFRSVESFIATTFNSSSHQNIAVSTNELLKETIRTVEPAIIKKANLTQVLNNLDSDFIVDTGNDNTPMIEEVEVAATEKVVEVIEIDVEKLLLDNKKQQEVAQERLVTNNELTKKLNELTRQLTVEKQRNEKLSAQINAHEDNNSKLTSLLENALKEVSSEDHKYLTELNNLGNSNSTTNSNGSNKTINTNNTASIDISAAINNQVAQLLPSTPTTTETTVDHNNSISLSTASQVDAIILAMQEIQQGISKPIQSGASGNIVTVGIEQNAKSESTDELLHIKLQRQINKMLAINEGKSSTYKKALKKESIVRKNAMRSIIVQKGETLWSIAKRAYGNGSLYTKIIKANPHIAKDGKVVLTIGQVIRVPI